MNLAAIKTTYDADGFVVLRGFLPPDDGSDTSSYDDDELGEADDEEA